MNYGYVDNFWAMRNYILRLGARIKDLKAKGYKIYGENGKNLNKPRSLWKNFYYFLEGSQNEERMKIIDQKILQETKKQKIEIKVKVQNKVLQQQLF